MGPVHVKYKAMESINIHMAPPIQHCCSTPQLLFAYLTYAFFYLKQWLDREFHEG